MKRISMVCLIMPIFLFLLVPFSKQDDFPVLKGSYLGQKPPGMTPELFAPGLITTEDGEGCSGWGNDMEYFVFQRWKDRNLLPKNPYKYPPSNPDPRTMDLVMFVNLFTKQEVVVTLASIFGGTYAEEICKRAGIKKKTEGSSLSQKEISDLYRTMLSIFKEDKKPLIYLYRRKPNDVTPIEMEIYKRRKSKSFSSFTEALDEFFTKKEKKAKKKRAKKKIEEKKEKFVRIKKRQRKAIEDLKKRKKSAEVGQS